MKKSLNFALCLSITVSAIALNVFAEEKKNFELDENAQEQYQLKEVINGDDTAINKENTVNDSKILREDIDGGYIEKLLDDRGNIIAEKTVKDDKVIQQTLMYYAPDGKLIRRITISEDQASFDAEEYYPNGKRSATASFINESNKIGKERKFDINGVLRQEIEWALPELDEKIPLENVRTIRYGDVITYYPNGTKAAVFTIGKDGKNIFYGKNGEVIKEIDGEILNFNREDMILNCSQNAIQLSLEDLVELYEDEGDISYNKCGLPYRETFSYEILDEKDNRATKISFDETGMIRRMAYYEHGQKQGKEQKFDASGNLTAEINYVNGLKEGESFGYFPTHERAFRKQYNNDKVEGTLTCYFPTGQVAAEFHYKDGLKEGFAKINSPIEKELEFSKDEIINNSETSKTRQLVSLISGLETPDEKCLNFDDKLSGIQKDIETYENSIKQLVEIKLPDNCQDMSAFIFENDQYSCFDSQNGLHVSAPVKEGYTTVKVTTKDGKLINEIPYVDNKRQGIAKKYDEKGNLVAEIYYNNDTPAETSRSYYPNGRVNEMFSIADGSKRQVITKYQPNGVVKFSLSYNNGKKNLAYINKIEKNKDVYVRYYEGEIDNIHETNAEKLNNYIDYNLALGEYVVYQENELVRGGKLCPIQGREVIEDLQPLSKKDLAEMEALAKQAKETEKEYTVENAIIPSKADKKQAELAAQNIGPTATPDIEELTDVVAKERVEEKAPKTETKLSNTEKFYYPNGNLRKSIKTKGSRTEEIKEYSKNGLLLTDTIYDDSTILIEKYFGTGQIRRKTTKNYDDNAIMAFISREDFFDNGNARYAISRRQDTLLFNEKTYLPTGNLKQEIEQETPLSMIIKEYDKDNHLLKVSEIFGKDEIVKEYDLEEKVKSMHLNNKEMPVDMAKDSKKLLQDGGKIYQKGVLTSELKTDAKKDTLFEYYPGQKVKTEIVFFNTGEISVKEFTKNGTLQKFAYLSQDGKLHIEKPAVRTIPNYRERYWIDYNNPNWVENKDKYSIASIKRLYLDITAYILAELEIEVPELMRHIYTK